MWYISALLASSYALCFLEEYDNVMCVVTPLPFHLKSVAWFYLTLNYLEHRDYVMVLPIYFF